MQQIILNLDSTDNKLYYQNLIREGENLASELVINLSPEFQGYRYTLKFKNNENTEVVTEELIAVENQIKYAITNALTREKGTLKIELNAFDETGMLKKTATTTLRVLDALGETDEVVPEAFVPWYIQVFDLVENFTTDEAARVEAENLRETAEIGRGQAYTQAEQNRDALYDQAEIGRNNSYNQAESARDNLYNQAELTRTTAFNTTEETRNTNELARIEAENTRAAFYDGFESELSNKIKTSTFTASADNTTNIIHNLIYDSVHDDLLVIYNGILLEKTLNYIDNVNSISIDLVDWSINTGDKIFFKLYKNVK